MDSLHLKQAVSACKRGGIIAYPTEAVFGLGCLPMDKQAVDKILKLKKRSVEKGLILVAADIQQLANYVDFENVNNVEPIHDSWPGPTTWLVPAKAETPAWLTGMHETLAVRVSANECIKELCKDLGPIVSTSANPQGLSPAKSSEKVKDYFPTEIDYIIPAEITGHSNPTEIRDALSGNIIRAG